MNQENSHILRKSVLVAGKLRDTLRAETAALKRFEKGQLLEIIAEKEALASELAQHMEGFREVAEGESAEDHTHRTVLKELLGEIVECNRKNQVFIEGSLGHWQELLTICLPGTYVLSHPGQAARQSMPAKGLALNREV